MDNSVMIRPFEDGDATQVRDLFVRVNRLLAPPHLKQAFEDYIERSLQEEIDHIAAYYERKSGGFWVAISEQKLLGMFGLEAAPHDSMELRRMYVDPDTRRRGVASKMLRYAEEECRRRRRPRLDLSTSELQADAVLLYRKSGYQLARGSMVKTWRDLPDGPLSR